MNVGALVTLVAAVHYFYMREFWVIIHSSPILYRYIDWSITVPLQMIEFNLILRAVKPDIGAGMFWRLMGGPWSCSHSVTLARVICSVLRLGLGWVSLSAWQGGASSCSRYSWVRLVPRRRAVQLTDTCKALLQRCASLSPP